MDDGVLNRDFLANLQSEYRHVRKYRADHLLKIAGQNTFDAETRRRYLDQALAFDPHAMATVLHDIMGRDTSAPSDRSNAATLYLHGGSMGWWGLSPLAAERARALLAPGKPSTKTEKEPPPMKRPRSRKAIAAVASDHNAVGLLVTVTQAGALMEASLNDPKASDEAKLEAIGRFFRVAGRIAPDELDASLAKASETLTANPQPRST